MEKTCTKCELPKDTSQFGRDSKAPDGLFYWCKECLHRFNTSPERQVYMRKYRREWSQRPEAKAKLEAYHQTPEYKALKRDWQNRFIKNNPDIIRARQAVIYAVRTGNLPKATSLLCAHCDQPAREYHHALGYAKEDWLHVEPVCKACHSLFHRKD